MTVIENQASRWSVASLVEKKAGGRIAACIPARDEGTTIGSVIEIVARLREAGLVDHILVVDDGSTDETNPVSRAAGATVVANRLGTGKGQALRTGLASTDAEIVVFLDADVTNFAAHFVTDLVAPLLLDPDLVLVKATYRRSLDGRVDEGGRVNELVARPLLRRFFPALAAFAQPLAGECALRRSALVDVDLDDGYGIEIGLLIDIHRRHGLGAVTQVDLGERVHRNRPLHELQPHADEVLAAVLARVHCDPETGVIS